MANTHAHARDESYRWQLPHRMRLHGRWRYARHYTLRIGLLLCTVYGCAWVRGDGRLHPAQTIFDL